MAMSGIGTQLGRFSGVLVVALLVPLPGLGPVTGTYAAPPLQARAVTPRASVLAQPLGFEPNVGQTGRGVTFLLHGSGYALALLPNSLLFTLTHPSAGRLRMAGLRP